MSRKPLNSLSTVNGLTDRLDTLSIASSSTIGGRVASKPPPGRRIPKGMYSLSTCDLGVRVEFDPDRSDRAAVNRKPAATAQRGPPSKPGSMTSSSALHRSTSQRNFSFSATQMRDIERSNEILVAKIVNSKPTANVVRRTTSTASAMPQISATAAINRRRQQQHIDRGNEWLQKRLTQIASRRLTGVPK